MNILKTIELCTLNGISIVVVQSLSRIRLFATPWAAAHQASLLFTISQSLFTLMSIESMVPSNHLILSCPLSSCLPSVFPSIRVFSNESALHIRWPKYWSFSFSISPSNEYSGLISFRIDWLDLLAVQGTQESSPAPQFQSINSLALSLLYGPTLSLLKLGTHLKMFSVFIETVIIMLTFLLSLLLDYELFRKRTGNVFLISFLELCRR